MMLSQIKYAKNITDLKRQSDIGIKVLELESFALLGDRHQIKVPTIAYLLHNRAYYYTLVNT